MPVKGGAFLMGSTEDDDDGYNDERPQHKVSIGHDMVVMRYPVTQKVVRNGERS